MPNQDDIRYQQELLQHYRTTLRHYLKQRVALSQSFEPPAVAAGIAEARQGIAQCKVVLRGWGMVVEDLPEDDDGGEDAVLEPPLFPRSAPQATLLARTPRIERLALFSRVEHEFFWRWVWATALGGTVGSALGQMIQMAVTLSLCTIMGNTERYFVGWLVGGLFAGALIGALQSAVLPKHLLPMARWIVATTAGFGVGWAVRDWQGWRLGQAFGDAGYLMGWVLAGLIVGCAQSLALRRFVPGTRWLIATHIVAAVGWWYGSLWAGDALSVGSVMIGWDMLDAWRGDISACWESENQIVGPLGNIVWGLPTGIVGGISAGLLTGIVLVALLRSRLRQQPHMPDD